MSPLKVSELASQVGTSPDTLRYYERIGLLPPPERTTSGYRQYGDEAVERLRFIKGAQRFGLRLDAIRELLEIRERGMCPCGHTRELLEAKLAELDGEMAALVRLRDDIRRMVDVPATAEALGSACTTNLIQIQPAPSPGHRRPPTPTPGKELT